MSKPNGNGGAAQGGRPSDNMANEFKMPGVSGGTPISGMGIASDAALSGYEAESIDPYEATEILNPGDAAQFDRIQKAIFDLLDAFNVNWDDPNYTETPYRVAKAYVDYWANGYARLPEDEITVFPNASGSRDLVMVKDMQFYSMCSHHLAPFKGYGAVAYIPGDNLLGLSKLGRIMDIFARRFQLQERVGSQTADALMRLIEPQGVMVVLYDVEHMCMSSRGVQMHAANTTTITSRGVFETDADLRNQVIALLR